MNPMSTEKVAILSLNGGPAAVVNVHVNIL